MPWVITQDSLASPNFFLSMLWALGVVLLTLQSFYAQPGTQQCEGIHTQTSINFLVAPSFPELCPATPSCLSLPQTLFPQFCKAVGLYLNSLSLLFCLPEKYLQAESVVSVRLTCFICLFSGFIVLCYLLCNVWRSPFTNFVQFSSCSVWSLLYYV